MKRLGRPKSLSERERETQVYIQVVSRNPKMNAPEQVEHLASELGKVITLHIVRQ